VTRVFSAIAIAVTAAATSVAASCADDPRLVGPCFTVHGRLHTANGTPSLRLWPVGTRRLLGIGPGDDREMVVPPTLLTLFEQPPERRVYGDFEVCPFTADRAGRMRIVCIESYSTTFIEDDLPEP
jgi:hypothetical protein